MPATFAALPAVLPVALTVLIGYGARRSGIVPASLWQGVEIFCYRVLFPAIMLVSVYHADLGWSRIGPFGTALLLTTAAAALVVLALRRILALPDPRFTTLFQTVTRWNAFIALALATQLTGPKGIGLISVAMAFLIPVVNVVNVLVMSIWGSGKAGIFGMIKAILSNPIILGCAAGLALNLGGIPLPRAADNALGSIGAAAIPVSLIIVGAGIQIDRLWSLSLPLIAAVTLRLIAMPCLFWLVARWMGLAPELVVAGVLACAVPTAANGYLVARQMGGDADLYADILTWQTVLALLSIPFILSLLT